jgi:Mg-chelatase subunit ChlD
VSVTFGTKIWLESPFTRDVAVLRAALPKKGDPALARSPTLAAGTPLWLTLMLAMQQFDQAAPERPVILVLSDGQQQRVRFTTASVTDVIDRAQRRGVMIYSVGVHGSRFSICGRDSQRTQLPRRIQSPPAHS